MLNWAQVGHILGLGDRHPSNLLLDRHSGMIVYVAAQVLPAKTDDDCSHVDFGDCFEIAMKREKFPEQVRMSLSRRGPRLTRRRCPSD
jgi:FKBP12-rapamycin complex-associated protein